MSTRLRNSPGSPRVTRPLSQVIARALILSAASGVLLAFLVVGGDLGAPPDDDPMSFPIGVNFVLAVPLGAISGVWCAVPAVGAWMVTARLKTRLRYLAASLAAAAGVGFIAIGTGELSSDVAWLAGGAALAAAVFAPTITSCPAPVAMTPQR